MDDARIAWKIREKIHQFSGKLSADLPKTAQRLVREVVFGVQSRGSVRLSEIARALEENISIKKIIERLGRQLQRGGLREQVRENLLQLAAGRIDSQTLLVVDPPISTSPMRRRCNTWRRFETDRRGGSKTVIGVAKWWGPAAAVLRCCRSIRSCTRKKPPTLSAKTMRS